MSSILKRIGELLHITKPEGDSMGQMTRMEHMGKMDHMTEMNPMEDMEKEKRKSNDMGSMSNRKEQDKM